MTPAEFEAILSRRRLTWRSHVGCWSRTDQTSGARLSVRVKATGWSARVVMVDEARPLDDDKESWNLFVPWSFPDEVHRTILGSMLRAATLFDPS